MPQTTAHLLPLVARIVSAHVQNNVMPAQALPGLIRSVYGALVSIERREERVDSAPVIPRKGPAGQTIFDDALVCMECGTRMKMLKRHLQTVHNQTPSEYRTKWRLTGDYPMVARQYAELRSSLAKKSGLGKRPSSRRA